MEFDSNQDSDGLGLTIIIIMIVIIDDTLHVLIRQLLSSLLITINCFY